MLNWGDATSSLAVDSWECMEGHGGSRLAARPGNETVASIIPSVLPGQVKNWGGGGGGGGGGKGGHTEELRIAPQEAAFQGLDPPCAEAILEKGLYWTLVLAAKALASVMKTSRSPLWQVPSCSLFFGFLILFARGAPADNKTSPMQTTMEPSTMAGSISSVSPHIPENLTATDTVVDVSTEPHPVLAATPSHNETTPASELAPKQPSTPKHVGPKVITAQKEPATLKQTKQATTGPTTTGPSREATSVAATTPHETKITTVRENSTATVGGPASFNATAATVGNTGLKPRSRKGETENTTPGQRVIGDPTTHDARSWGLGTTYTTETSSVGASTAGSGVKGGPSQGSRGGTVTPAAATPHAYPTTAASPAKGSQAIIVAIVLSILLFVVLLIALLCCWRRRHSGSTSFKATGWAGQAALPDDSGLDKEVEQGAMAAGEGETRRATLTTFFGKRQSRVPSVAMEDVVRKESCDVEEAQLLINENASNVPNPEGSGEANGRLPESTEQCSQEKEFPPPPADQEAPPTQEE
ncbi:uncharacterized protein LOC143826047 [Paroedura picta]|uniref:uncharacterized protein LOC143826047 n=1 Tax=Paroedura picta TaxID=143630 RepID=UPI004056D31B